MIIELNGKAYNLPQAIILPNGATGLFGEGIEITDTYIGGIPDIPDDLLSEILETPLQESFASEDALFAKRLHIIQTEVHT